MSDSKNNSFKTLLIGVATIVLSAIVLKELNLKEDGTPFTPQPTHEPKRKVEKAKFDDVDEEFELTKKATIRAWRDFQEADRLTAHLQSNLDTYMRRFRLYMDINLVKVDPELKTLILNTAGVYLRAVKHFDNFSTFSRDSIKIQISFLATQGVSKLKDDPVEDWHLIEQDLDNCSRQDKLVAQSLSKKYMVEFIDEY